MPGGARLARLVTCSHGHHAAAHNLGARHHAAAHRLHGEGRGENIVYWRSSSLLLLYYVM